jgi:hypothetical protein
MNIEDTAKLELTAIVTEIGQALWHFLADNYGNIDRDIIKAALIVTGNAIGQVGEPEASAHEDMN